MYICGADMKLLQNKDKSKFFILTITGLVLIYMILDTIVSAILFGLLKLDGHPYQLDGHPADKVISLLTSIIALVISIFIAWKFSGKKFQVRRGTWSE